jgi:hypothetical protein
VTTIDRVFVATHRRDVRLTRICVASIRHWYPDIPICLLKDEAFGSFSTRELEEHWNVRVWKTERRPYGWGFIKLEPLFQREAGRYLVLDSDIAFIGPVLDELQQFGADFVVHGETQPGDRMRELYFEPSLVQKFIDRSLAEVPFTFNSGQYVATGGLLDRSDFDSVLTWNSPPVVRYPEFFNRGDQGVLNYVLLKRQAEGALSIDSASFMKWEAPDLESLDLSAIATSSPYAALIHWAGMKRNRLGAMPRADILRFFEHRYYARIKGGRLRLGARIAVDFGRRLAERVTRKVRSLANARTIAPIVANVGKPA